MLQLFANNAVTTLTSAVSSAALSLPVASTAGFPNPGTNQYFLVTLQSGTSIEVIQIIGVSGNNLLVSPTGRGWEGSTAAGFPSGAACEVRVTAGTLSSFDKYFAPGTTLEALIAPSDSYQGGYSCVNSLDPEGTVISVLQNSASSWGILNYIIIGQDSAASSPSTGVISTTAASLVPTAPSSTYQYLIQITSGTYTGYIRGITAVNGTSVSLSVALPAAPVGSFSVTVYRSVQDLLKTFAQPAQTNNFQGSQNFVNLNVSGSGVFSQPVTAPAAQAGTQLVTLAQGNFLWEPNGAHGGTYTSISASTQLTASQSGQRILPQQPLSLTLPQATVANGAYYEIYGSASGVVQVIGSIVMPDGTQVSTYSIPQSKSAVIALFSDGNLWRARTFGSEVVLSAMNDNQSVNLGQLRRVSPNLLFNSSALFGLIGWTGTNWTAPQVNGYQSSSYFSFSANGTSGTLTSSGVQNLAAQTYYLSAELYNGLSGGNLTVSLVGYNGTNSIGTLGTLTLASGNGWTYLSSAISVPANATQVKIVLSATGAGSGTNVAVSRIKLELGNYASPYSNEGDLLGISSNPLAIGQGVANNHAVTLGQISNYLTPAGTIIDFAGTMAPAGYLVCDGSPVSRSAYPYLFSVIGTTWGGGDGSTTFNLPNLQRRVTIGAGGTQVSGPGVNVGNVGGEETHTLITSEIPSHGHGVNDPTHVHGVNEAPHTHVLNDPGHGHQVQDPSHSHAIPPGGWGQAGQDNGGGSFTSGSNQYGTFNRAVLSTYPSFTGIYLSTSYTGVTLNGARTGLSLYGSATGISIQTTGGGSSHNNMQPSVTVLKCIKF